MVLSTKRNSTKKSYNHYYYHCFNQRIVKIIICLMAFFSHYRQSNVVTSFVIDFGIIKQHLQRRNYHTTTRISYFGGKTLSSDNWYQTSPSLSFFTTRRHTFSSSSTTTTTATKATAITTNMEEGQQNNDNNTTTFTTTTTTTDSIQPDDAITSSSRTNNNNNDNNTKNNDSILSLPKVHTMTVCMVPPPVQDIEYKNNNQEVWDRVTKLRETLRDPGLYRWPPHVNLLYPFLDHKAFTSIKSKKSNRNNNHNDSGKKDNNNDDDDTTMTSLHDNDDMNETDRNSNKKDNDDNNTTTTATTTTTTTTTTTITKEKQEIIKQQKQESNLQDIVQLLQTATEQCEPFNVSLNSFGTFGGKNRGVLWLYPNSTRSSTTDNEEQSQNDMEQQQPLIYLQQKLVETFPTCNDVCQKGSSKNKFSPHMTLSHFESLQDAKNGQEYVIQKEGISDDGNFTTILDGLDFVMDRIYLLQRINDSGQFLRIAQIGLGKTLSSKNITKIYNPPIPFPDMPLVESDWVYEERMKLKARRNRSGGGRRRRNYNNRRRGGQRRYRSKSPRIPDTPEEIAAKRAARKAKREALEQQQQQQQNEME